MITYRKKDSVLFKVDLFLTFSLFVVSSSAVVYEQLAGNIIEMVVYGLLLGGILLSCLSLKLEYIKKHMIIQTVIVGLLLSVGIILQQLSVRRTALLLLTTIAITIVSQMAEYYLKSFEDLKVIAYAIFIGAVVSLCLALLAGFPIVINSAESTFGIYWSFTGGIKDKNIATIMLSIVICLFTYYRSGGKLNVFDSFLIVVSLMIIILSNSRGAWILTASYFASQIYEVIKYVDKRYRAFVVAIVFIVVIALAVVCYVNVLSKSGTFMYRVRGWQNYLRRYRYNREVLLIGNCKIAYDQGVDYTIAVRRITGYDGTLEIAWLNILIKSGFIGIIGYIFIFIRSFYIAFSSRSIQVQTMCISVVVTLLLSSFVSPYIQNIHQFYGVFSYIVMSFLNGLIHSKKEIC